MIMPNVQDWIDRITADVTALDTVGGSLEAARDFSAQTLPTPSAYVVLSADSAEPDDTITHAIQRVEMTVAIWVCVRNHGPGAVGDAALQPLRAAILESLLSWVPPCCDGPVSYAGGTRVSSVDMDLLIWREEFSAPYWLRVIE